MILIAGYDGDSDELTPLFNPRTQAWNEHFTFKEAVIVGKTPIGRVTIHQLQMNHPDRLVTRQSVIEDGEW